MFPGSVARLLLRQPTLLQRKALSTLLNKSSSNLLRVPLRQVQPIALNRVAAAPDGVQYPESHAGHFKIERIWAAMLIPLLPAAYFVHGPAMDTMLSVAIALHTHWGIQGIVYDYARPFVIGEGLAAVARASVYVITALLLAGLFHFNYNDVGLTKAFEMVWAL